VQEKVRHKEKLEKCATTPSFLIVRKKTQVLQSVRPSVSLSLANTETSSSSNNNNKKKAAKNTLQNHQQQQQQQATRTKRRAWEWPPTNVKETGQIRKRRDTRKILVPEKGDLISIMCT
jgi:hypothetical protein